MRIIAITLASLVLLTSCENMPSRKPPLEVWDDMDRQQKFKAQSETTLFRDGRANRPPAPGTIAVGHLNADVAYHTGAMNGSYVGKNPEKYTEEFLKLGQSKFNIYCSPCHDRYGSGQGVVGKKAVWPAQNLHEQRILDMTDGELFEVISNGRRTMHGYRFQTTAQERWAIAAYVRVLQRSGIAKPEDVPAEFRDQVR
jgi:mono/diheme cytochrome c family protein